MKAKQGIVLVSISVILLTIINISIDHDADKQFDISLTSKLVAFADGESGGLCFWPQVDAYYIGECLYTAMDCWNQPVSSVCLKGWWMKCPNIPDYGAITQQTCP